MLSDRLEERGFKKSAINPCLFTREDCIIVTYVDDCLIHYKKKEILMELIESIKDNFKLTDESDSESFLRIQFKKIDKLTLQLSQPDLIERINNTLGLREECKMHDIPSNVILTKDVDSKLRK